MTEYLKFNILRPFLKQWHYMLNIGILAAGATLKLLSSMSRGRKWGQLCIFLEAGCHKTWNSCFIVIYVLLQCFHFSSLIFFWTWISVDSALTINRHRTISVLTSPSWSHYSKDRWPVSSKKSSVALRHKIKQPLHAHNVTVAFKCYIKHTVRRKLLNQNSTVKGCRAI